MKLKELRSELDQYEDSDRVEVTAYPIIEAIEAEIEHARAMIDIENDVTEMIEEEGWAITALDDSRVESKKVAQMIAEMVNEQLTRYLGKGTEWLDEVSEFTVGMVSAGLIHIGPEVS